MRSSGGQPLLLRLATRNGFSLKQIGWESTRHSSSVLVSCGTPRAGRRGSHVSAWGCFKAAELAAGQTGDEGRATGSTWYIEAWTFSKPRGSTGPAGMAASIVTNAAKEGEN